jgi:hypothetical protein
MTDKRLEYLQVIDEEAKWHYSLYRRARFLQMVLMIAIAVAGLLTASAGLSEHRGAFYSTPTALLVWGIVSVVCATINQWANPERRSSKHFNVKMALRAVEGAVKNRDMPLADAEMLHTLTFKNPEAVIEKLSGAADQGDS